MLSILFTIGLGVSNLALISVPAPPAKQAASPNSSEFEATTKDVEALRSLLTKEIQSALDRTISSNLGLTFSSKAEPKADADPDEPTDKTTDKTTQPKATVGDSRWLGLLSLNDEGDGHLTAWGSQLGGRYYTANRSGTSFTRGFYCPGVGAWIDTTVTLPAEFYLTVEGSSIDDMLEIDAAWDLAVRETSGKSDASAGDERKSLRIRFDVARRNAVIAATKGTLIRFGARVRNLADEESVVIALKLECESSSPRWLGITVAAGADGGEWAKKNMLTQPNLLAGNAVASMVPETVVMRVRRSDLAAHAAGEIGDDVLDKRIQITKY